MVTDSSKSMVDGVLTIMSVLASYQEAKVAIVKASTIPVLNFDRSFEEGSQGCSVCSLYELLDMQKDFLDLQPTTVVPGTDESIRKLVQQLYKLVELHEDFKGKSSVKKAILKCLVKKWEAKVTFKQNFVSMLLHQGHPRILSGFFSVLSCDVSVSVDGILGFSTRMPEDVADFSSSVV
ncbi:hypothetical protein RJT34_02433 [Clitoria ternatea]|uniref:Uncharacterized protein n=1 Tax=Clitoria ternatea TaxID=43366 RepID=A0AAN9KKE7_CLITE